MLEYIIVPLTAQMSGKLCALSSPNTYCRVSSRVSAVVCALAFLLRNIVLDKLDVANTLMLMFPTITALTLRESDMRTKIRDTSLIEAVTYWLIVPLLAVGITTRISLNDDSPGTVTWEPNSLTQLGYGVVLLNSIAIVPLFSYSAAILGSARMLRSTSTILVTPLMAFILAGVCTGIVQLYTNDTARAGVATDLVYVVLRMSINVFCVAYIKFGSKLFHGNPSKR